MHIYLLDPPFGVTLVLKQSVIKRLRAAGQPVFINPLSGSHQRPALARPAPAGEGSRTTPGTLEVPFPGQVFALQLYLWVPNFLKAGIS